MKKTSTSIKTALAVGVCIFTATASWAADGVWSGTVNALWTNSNNWSASPFPSGTDTASFNTAGNSQTTLDLAGLSSITFMTYSSPAVAAYTNGIGAANSQTLVLADNGVITLTDTAANSQVFNCGLQLGTTMAAGTYTLTNANTTQTLTFNKIFGAPSGGTAAAKTLVVNGAGNTTILGDISRGGATSLTLTDNSSGTLTLSGSNTITTLNMNGGASSVVDIGSGYLSLENSGALILGSSQGGTINGNGTIRLSTDGGTGYADIKPAAGKTLVINPSIISIGGFELNDSGTVELNGTNTFSGEVFYTANNGTIVVSRIGNKGSIDSNLGKGTKVYTTTAVGCTLRYKGIGETTDRIIEINRDFTLDNSGTGELLFSAPFTVLANAKTLTLQGSTVGVGEIGGAIGPGTGTTSLSKNGTGTWILSAANTYAGTTAVNGGTLTLAGANGAINASTGYTINAGGTLLLDNTSTANNTNRLRDATTVTMNGGTLCMTNNGGAMSYCENAGALLVNLGNNTIATAQADVNQSNTLTFTSLAYVSGRINFTGTGLGDSDRNRIFINGVTNGLMGAWATVNGTSYAAYSSTLGVYAFTTGFSDIAAEGGVAESVIPDDGSLLARINLPGISGPIALYGEWTNSIGQVLQNTTTNTTLAMFDGVTNKLLRAAGLSIAEGKAELKVGVSENDGTLSALTAGGTLVLENNSAGNALTVNAAIVNNTSASALSKIGAGTVVLNGTNTYSGNTYISEGVLAFGGSLTQTVTAAISGVGALAKTGNSTLNLNAASTYSGGTTIDGGSIVIAPVVGSLGTGGVANNGTLNLTAATTGADYSYTFGNLSGSGTVNMSLPPSGNSKSTRINGTTNFTGTLNVGVNQGGGTGRLYPIAQFLQLSAPAIVNIKLNSTMLMDKAVTNTAAINLYGGTTGEAFGQLRIENGVQWAGPVTLFASTTFGGNGTATEISGAIGENGGNFGITRLGSGTTVLSGANTYSGPTWVKAGAISVPSINSVNSGAGTLGSPINAAQGTVKLGDTTVVGTLIYTGTGNTSDRLIDFAGTTGGATLDHSGTGSLTLTGGMILSGVGAKLLTLQGWTTGSAEFSGVISNGVGSTVSLTKTGTVTWILSGANTYSGITTVNGGTLDVSGSLNSSGITISGGTGTKVIARRATALGAGEINFAAGATTPRLELKIDGGGIIALPNAIRGNSSITSTIDVNNNGNGSDGIIQLNGLSVSGMGTANLNVTGGNGYSLYIASLKNSAGGAGSMLFNPTTASLSLGNLWGNQASGANIWVLDGTASGNFVTGVISNNPAGGATSAVTKQNSSTWTLTGVNAYTGATTVNGGTLLINGSIVAASAVTVNNSGTLGGSGTINGAVTCNAGGALAPGNGSVIGTLNMASSLTLNSNTLLFDVSNAATDLAAITGVLTNNGLNIVSLMFPAGPISAGTYTLMNFASKVGNGVFVLARSYPNASLTLSATSLVLTVGTGGSTTGLTWNGNLSSTWDVTQYNWMLDGTATHFERGDAVTFDDTAVRFTVDGDIAVSPVALAFNNISNYTVNTVISGTAPIVKVGSGTATLAGLSTFNPASIVVSAGTLALGGASQLNSGLYANNIINNGTFNYASSALQTSSGEISGLGGLTVSGSGTLTLSGSNLYSGAIAVNLGVLKIQHGYALGTTAGNTTVAAGGTLELAGNITTLAEGLTLYGTLSSQTGTNTYVGAVSFNAGAFVDVGAGSAITLSEHTGGTGAFTKIGAGLLKLTHDPNHTGTMTINEGSVELAANTSDANYVINNGGVLIGNNTDAINRVNSVTVNAGGFYVLRQSDIINMLSGAGTLTRDITGAAYIGVGDNNGSSTFSGVIENGLGTLSFTKSGTGIQTLVGMNSYTGATTVTGGTLFINSPGALANSAVTVNNGCTLGGSGTLSGTVNMFAGATLITGDTNVMGTLTLANNSATSLTLNGNSLRFDISNEAGVCDKIDITGEFGKLVLNGTNTIALSFPFGPALPGIYTLMSCAGGITTNVGASLALQSAYPNATLGTVGNDVILTVSEGGTYDLTWKGNESGSWDSGMNWTNGSTAVAFATGDHVTFDDTAIGNFTVSSGSPVSPGSVLFNNSVNAYVVSADMGGTGPLVKLGSSTATLSGATNYNPSLITVYPLGTLALGGASQLNNGDYAGNINNLGTFTYASSATQTLSGIVFGPGALTKSGLGTLILSNASTRTGATTLSGGTLMAKDFATALGTGALTLNTASTILELDSDTGLVFNNNATVSAAMTVKSGRVTSGPGVTNTLGTLSIGNYQLNIAQGVNISGGSPGITFGATTLSASTPIFDVASGSTLTLGALGGNYNFTKQNSGTLFLGTASGRTGNWATLTAGTLKLGHVAALGTTGPAIQLNGGILDLATDATVNAYPTTVGGNTTVQSDKATAGSAGITHTLGPLSIGAFTLSVTNGPNVRLHSPFGLTFGVVTLTGIATNDVANNGTGLGTLTLGAISGNFSLTKKNFGTLKFAGINVYNGATTINNGRVMGVSNASCSNSAFTVQSTQIAGANASLGILCSVANGQWVCTNLTTIAATAPATALPALDFLFNVPPSTNVAPLRVLNNVVFSVTPVVNVYLGNVAVLATNYPLMVVGGTAPTAVPALNMIGGYTNSTLFWNGKILTLNLVGTPLPMKWNPGVTSSGTWDINNSANLVWTNGVAAKYYQEPAGTGVTGDQVLFDDDFLTGNSTVTLNNYVSPTLMTVSNVLYSYTIAGNGGIMGTNSLTKFGTNALTLATANTYSGATTVNDGILALSGLGTLSINSALTLGGGMLDLGGLSTSVGPVNITATPANNNTIQNGSLIGSSYVANFASGIATVTANLLGTGALTKSGAGTIALSGTNVLGAVTVNDGSLVLGNTSSNSTGTVTVKGTSLLTVNGPTTLGANTITVANAAGERSMAMFSADATMGKLLVGYTTAGAAGSVIQEGGTVLVGTNTISADVLSLGTYGGYGYYRKNGGSLATGQLAITGNNNNSNNAGVFDLFGGTVDVVPPGGWLIFGWQAGQGVFNIFGGSVYAPPGGNNTTMAFAANRNFFGMLNLLGSGALLDATGKGTARWLDLAATTGNKASVLNLKAGVCLANRVGATVNTTPSFVNFDGGTLKANVSTNNFLQGISFATIYPGGAMIDTTNANITIAQNLLAPTGYGVDAIPLLNNGAGYIGAPVVMISGGGGTGMTAIASVDLTDGSPTKGSLTGITMTSKGTGYQPTDVLSVALIGGGFTAAAVTGACSFAENSAAGGLTKIGSGTLTLSGINTYGGNTVINNGKLLGVTGASCSNSAVSVTATEGNSAIFGVTITDNTKQWTCASLMVTNNGISSDLEFDFGNVVPSTTLAPLNVIGEAAFTTQPTVTVKGINNIGGLVGTRYPLMVWGSSSGTPPTAVNISSLRGISAHLEVADNTLMLVIDSNSQPLSWALSTAGVWDTLATNWVDGVGVETTYTQTVTPGDQVMFSDGPITADTTVTLTNTVSPANVTASNTLYTYTIAGTGAIAGTTSLTKLGAGTLTLNNANTYIGGTILSEGQLNINKATAIGAAASRLTINGGMIDNTSGADLTLTANNPQSWNGDFTYIGSKNLSLGTGAVTPNNNRQITVSSNTLTVAGVISGAYGLTKAGNGTLTLSANNTYTGNVIVAGGNLNAPNTTSLGNLVAGRTITVTAGGTLNLTINNAVSGQPGITTPAITVNGGTLNATRYSASGLAAFNNSLVLQNGATMLLNNTVDSGSYSAWQLGDLVTVSGTSGSVITNGAGAYSKPCLYTNTTFNVLATGGTGYDLAVYAPLINQGMTGAAVPAGLTKDGAGTMALYAANTYTGPTLISNGKLVGVTGGSCIGSAVTNAAAAGQSAILGVLVTDNTKQWICPSLTVDNAGVSTDLEFDFGTVVPSTSLAPLKVTNTVTFTSTPTVTVKGSNIGGAPGTVYPLMTWTSSFGTPPTGVNVISTRAIAASLTVTGNTLNLVIDSNSGPLTWATSGTGMWNTNIENTVWQDRLGVITAYNEVALPGDAVIFSDSNLLINTVVTLDSTVTPGGMTVTNDAYQYTISGSGGIAGPVSLIKSGTNTLTLATANTYEGITALNSGKLILGHASALPAGNTLSMAGTAMLDMNGYGPSLINISASAAVNTITDSAGAGTTALSILNQTTTIATTIKDGASRTVAVNLANNNGGVPAFALNSSNTYSGGLTLKHTTSGTRLLVNSPVTTVGTPGNITSSPFGRGAITIGEAATDKAGLYITTSANNTIANDLIVNTTNGTDATLIYTLRVDTTGINVSGKVTANSDLTFGSNGTGAIALTNEISGAGGVRLVTSTTALTVALTGPNTYTGKTTLPSGSTLSFTSIGNVGSGPSALGAPETVAAGTITVGNGTTTGMNLLYRGMGHTTDRVLELAGTTGGLTINHSGTNLLKFTSNLLMSGSGAKRFALTGANNSTGEVAGVIANSPVGVVDVYKSGISSTWRLSATNTFTGPVEIYEGKLIITDSNSLGLGNKSVRASNGSSGNPQLHLDGSEGAIVLGANLTFYTSNQTDGSLHNIAGTNIIKGNVSMTGGGGGTMLTSKAGKLTCEGKFTPDQAGRNLYLRGNGEGEISGVIANGITTNMPILRDSGSGTWTLSGMNTYSGPTTISVGAIAAGSDQAFGVSNVVNLTGGNLGGAVGT